MPDGLLGLPDEVLVRIAHFTHQDTYLPLPSFNPHFENLSSEIHARNNLDFLHFRHTCRRTFSAIPLRGLHLGISTWRSLERYSTKPAHFKSGIRRLSICINIWEFSQQESKEKYDAQGMWKTVTNFLYQLTSLEELSIEDLPFCFHGTGRNDIKHLTPPSEDILPRVKSVAFQLRGTGSEEPVQVLDELALTCPLIRDLRFCSAIRKGSSSIATKFTLCLPTVPAYDEHTGTVKLIQDIQVVRDWLDPRESIEKALHRPGSSSATPSESHPLLDTLSKFTQLNMIDCFLKVTLDTSPIEQNFPDRRSTKTHHLESRQVHGINEETRLARPGRLHTAVREAALALAYRIPTLQAGCFWAWEPVCEQDEHYYRRWSWFIDQAEDGSSHVRLDPFTERFPSEFLANMDGTRLEHYVPYTEG